MARGRARDDQRRRHGRCVPGRERRHRVDLRPDDQRGQSAAAVVQLGHSDAHRLHDQRQLRRERRRPGELRHATLTDCTISGNSAAYGGGLENSGTAMLTNCTISGNSARNGGGRGERRGRGRRSRSPPCTISGNSADAAAAACGTLQQHGDAHRHHRGRQHRVKRRGDIGGNAAGQVTGSYNLIGTGGSGGIIGGSGGNIVLTSLADLGLAPLGNYGGPTQTMALLARQRRPSAPARPSAASPPTSVASRSTRHPISAPSRARVSRSRPVAGSTPQQTTDGTAFANPLAVVVTANNPLEPVAGGTVTFTAPSSGASAALTAGTVTIGTDGSASVIAADNSIAGSYIVTASIAGAAPVSFSLTNLVSAPVSTYTVNSTSGGFSGSGTSGTLPYVIFLANADANPSTNGNEIQFDPSVFATAQTITLSETLVSPRRPGRR